MTLKRLRVNTTETTSELKRSNLIGFANGGKGEGLFYFGWISKHAEQSERIANQKVAILFEVTPFQNSGQLNKALSILRICLEGKTSKLEGIKER